MGIQITNAKMSPEVVYDSVHLLSLHLTQDVYTDDTISPIYRLPKAWVDFNIVRK